MDVSSLDQAFTLTCDDELPDRELARASSPERTDRASPFFSVPASTESLLDQAYRLRYQVYCLERGFEDAHANPGGRERDKFDDHSVHRLLVHAETGLIVGGPDPDPGRPPPPGWEGFFGAGFAPALGALSYIARAVTPPIRPVRFNARFFVLDREHVTGEVRESGELLGLKWFTVEEALTLELAQITRRVLTHFGACFEDVAGNRDDAPVPYFKWTPTGHLLIDE